LAGLFKLFADTVECVVLNVCFSHVQAKAIAEYIPYVVGMGKSIGDRAAIEFAIAFYKALGEGRDYQFAFDFACIAIDLAGIPGSDIPKLFKRQKPSPEPSSSKPDPENKINQIIEKIISGNIVPFLGSGINPDFYIALVPSLVQSIGKYLNGNTSSEENWIPELIGIPCQVCPYLKDRPPGCPMLKGIEAESSCPLYKELLDKEQSLAVARMNLRYISQYFNLKDNLNDLYDELREIFQGIESHCPNKVHQLFAELPHYMKSKGYPKKPWKGLPYPMIITTNYDDLLERAFDDVGQEYDVLYYVANGKGGEFKHKGHEEANITNSYNNLPLRKPWGSSADPRPIILKLYGTAEDQFVMTQDQLNCLASGPIKQLPNILKMVISGSKGISILFLGYSPSDSELQLISNQIWSEKEPRLPKSSFMVHQSKPGKLEQEIWQQRGVELIDIDCSLEDFAISLQSKIEEKIKSEIEE
jgi:hypothetical protein